MRAHGQFAAPAQSQAANRRGDRFAAGFYSPDGCAELKEMVEGFGETRRSGRGHDHVIGGAQLGQIGADAEGGVFARADDHAAHIRRRQPGGEQAQLDNRGVGKDVHRPAWRVKHQVDQAIGLGLNSKLGQVGERQGLRTRPGRRP